MFVTLNSWPLHAVRVTQDDPALLVQNNQEKLLNSSVKKQVLNHSNQGKEPITTDNESTSEVADIEQQHTSDLALLATLVDSFSLDLQVPAKKGTSPGPDGITLTESQKVKLAVPPHVSYTFSDTITGTLSNDTCSELVPSRTLPWREEFLPTVPEMASKENCPPPGLEVASPTVSESKNLESSILTGQDDSVASVVSIAKDSQDTVKSDMREGGGAEGPTRFTAFHPKYNLEEILNEDDDDDILVTGFVTEVDEMDIKDGETHQNSGSDFWPEVSKQEDLQKLNVAQTTDSSVPIDASDEDLDELLSDSITEHSLSQMTTSTKSKTSTTSATGYKWASTEALPDSAYEALRPHLAMTYPFELDFFQKQAVMRLERRECVFVAAHTSAGKTVVAEYAIAMAKKHMSRTIYTSPIKALSNQKYRDFVEKFGADVGLITGDMSINPDASCLIMTTEILRSMLYRGSDVIRDIEWVIFDEVHYVNDAERGVVWEEVIIMLPERINLIFLSATTPNTIEFSDWIGRTKQRKVYVTSTSKRPVPLQHFFFHDDEVYPLMTPDGRFQPSAIKTAVARVKQKSMIKEKSAENAAMGMQRQQEKAAIAAQNRGGSVSKKGGRGGKGSGGGRGGAPTAAGRGVGGKGGAVSGGKAQWLSLIRLLFNGGRHEAGGLGSVDFGGACTVRKAKSSSGKMGSIGSKQQQEKYDRLPDYIKEQVSRKEYAQMDIRMDTAIPSSSADFDDEKESPDDDGEVGLLPVVVFCFSKKKCDEIIDFLKSMDFLTAKEKAEVKKLMAQVTNRLNPDDARLPQITRMTDLLTRGLAVHHGGLLPVLKEAVEILFSKSLVRVLLATETFAMGVNMPARAVVFNGFRKNDGKNFRDLLPGEYTQMAGRAGRRGKDTVGTVILANFSDIPQHAEVTFKTLLTGTATKLTSQFRLSYNMILNLLRVNDLSVEDMIKRSFSEFHMQRHMAKHDLGSKLKQLEGIVTILEQRKETSSIEMTTEEGTAMHDTAAFYDKYQLTSSLLFSHLSFVLSVRGSAGIRDLLNAGRFLLTHQVPCFPLTKPKKIAAPCLGVVLSDPLGSFSDDEKQAKAMATAALKQVETSKGRSLGMGLGSVKKSSLGIGLGTSGNITDDDLAQRPLSDLYVWVLLLAPRTVVSAGDFAGSTIQKVSLANISVIFEAKASQASVSSSDHLLGITPKVTEPISKADTPSISSSFGGMKMKMKMKGDDEAFFGNKPKVSKKGMKDEYSLSSNSGGREGTALSRHDSHATLVVQLYDFLTELSMVAQSGEMSSNAKVIDVSAAIKHREFKFAESCLKHGQSSREIFTEFYCWRFYLSSLLRQRTETNVEINPENNLRDQEVFLSGFLLEHQLFSAKEKVRQIHNVCLLLIVEF
jgi:superfamily II DNA/RNA helicase